MMASAKRSQPSLDFYHDTHTTTLLQGLQELRSENLLVDVILCVSGKEIPCHRNVLVACSGYFRAMFCNGHRESKEHKVTIHETSANTLQLLVDYAYTSKVTITEENAAELMEGASFFQVPPVSDACKKFLSDNLSIKNCMKMVTLGGMLNPNLEADALSYAMKEFSAVSKTPEFLDLTKDQLNALISSDDLNASEETVYTSVLKWIKHAPRKRKKEIRELMELVRFPWMDKMFFIEKVQTDKALCKFCPDIVSEAQKYHAFPGEVQSPRTRPRRASGLREAVVVIGGNEIFKEERYPSVFSDAIMMTHSSTPSSKSWISMTTMQDNDDHGFSVAVLGTSDIIVAGGTQRSDVWLYQTKLDSWSELSPMLTERDYCKLAVVRGKVYAIGGRTNDIPLCITADVEVYDQSLNKWDKGVPLQEPRLVHAVAVIDGSIYVMGGRDAKGNSTSTVYHFIPGDSQWNSASNMPEVCSFITASTANGSIHVAGLRSNVLCYRPQEDLWTVVAHTDSGLIRCGMTVFGGEIYIFGGCDNTGNGTTKVLHLNQEDQSLKQVGTMPKGLLDHVCVTILKLKA
ncbi:kelch-like protein 24a [Branchiostoma floridae x Branchiostoma japonicum]